ncbi:MAG: hypothetical protein LBB88_04015, partial [Planctomycetaceae bacterium]|nr:hypothetical protein [Planctomycetaceae bacterium]
MSGNLARNIIIGLAAAVVITSGAILAISFVGNPKPKTDEIAATQNDNQNDQTDKTTDSTENKTDDSKPERPSLKDLSRLYSGRTIPKETPTYNESTDPLKDSPKESPKDSPNSQNKTTSATTTPNNTINNSIEKSTDKKPENNIENKKESKPTNQTPPNIDKPITQITPITTITPTPTQETIHQTQPTVSGTIIKSQHNNEPLIPIHKNDLLEIAQNTNKSTANNYEIFTPFQENNITTKLPPTTKESPTTP